MLRFEHRLRKLEQMNRHMPRYVLLDDGGFFPGGDDEPPTWIELKGADDYDTLVYGGTCDERGLVGADVDSI